MACSACEKRRRMLKALKDKKKLKGQQVQAAAIGAVLAVSEAVGKAVGIHGEVEDEQVRRDSPDSAASGGHEGATGDGP